MSVEGVRAPGGWNGTTARISAVIGALAVVLGAFGAHGLEATLEANESTAIWETAARYHLVHSVALYFLAGMCPTRRWAWGWFAGGVGVFSGTLYLLAVTGAGWLGAITPLGGLALIAGWVCLALPAGAGGRGDETVSSEKPA